MMSKMMMLVMTMMMMIVNSTLTCLLFRSLAYFVSSSLSTHVESTTTASGPHRQGPWMHCFTVQHQVTPKMNSQWGRRKSEEEVKRAWDKWKYWGSATIHLASGSLFTETDSNLRCTQCETAPGKARETSCLRTSANAKRRTSERHRLRGRSEQSQKNFQIIWVTRVIAAIEWHCDSESSAVVDEHFLMYLHVYCRGNRQQESSERAQVNSSNSQDIVLLMNWWIISVLNPIEACKKGEMIESVIFTCISDVWVLLFFFVFFARFKVSRFVTQTLRCWRLTSLGSIFSYSTDGFFEKNRQLGESDEETNEVDECNRMFVG